MCLPARWRRALSSSPRPFLALLFPSLPASNSPSSSSLHNPSTMCPVREIHLISQFQPCAGPISSSSSSSKDIQCSDFSYPAYEGDLVIQPTRGIQAVKPYTYLRHLFPQPSTPVSTFSFLSGWACSRPPPPLASACSRPTTQTSTNSREREKPTPAN